MSNKFLNKGNWPVHCKQCKCACPVDNQGRLRQPHRIYCPPCFMQHNPGKEQPYIPKDWVPRCNWDFLEENYPRSYSMYFKQAAYEMGAAAADWDMKHP